MKLIVGLGNPDKEYNNTYHNLGFAVADKIAEKLSVSFTKEKCKALLAERILPCGKVIVAKPQTYMNLSGESVRELCSFYKMSLTDIIIIYDDYDLIKGSIRIREGGSAGTHNGMRNVVSLLGAENFARIRIGFHPQGDDINIPILNLVLSKIKEEDRPLFDNAIEEAAVAAVQFAECKPINQIMQWHNKK